MAIDEILENILSRPFEKLSDTDQTEMNVGRAEKNGASDVSLHDVVLAIEQVCREKYKDPGSGLHFVGLLLAVFSAGVVSSYCHKTAQIEGQETVADGRSPWMVSCLYSKDTVAFVLSHPLENQRRVKSKFIKIWGDAIQEANSAGHRMEQPTQLDEKRVVYTVSAAVNILNSSKAETKRHLPFFSCPRKYSGESQAIDGEPHYIQERFEELDLLPIYSVALSSSSAQEALDVIIGANRPQGNSFALSASTFNEHDFSMQQFVRGYGNRIDWLSDPTLIQATKPEIDTHPSLAPSKVIGAFGSVLHPHILFRQENIVGVYSMYSKEHFLLSKDGDFFGAGLEYSTYDKRSRPGTAESLGSSSISAPTKLDDVQPEGLEMNHSLSPNVSPFSHSDGLYVPQNPRPESEDPSFFSPSFADHLTASSNSHDPRIHSIGIPIHITTPTRSHSCSSSVCLARMSQTPSPFSKWRKHSLRNPSKTSETFPPNITPVLSGELENLIRSQSMLLVDIRAFSAYAMSRLVDAINVCIPTILLKRSSFSIDEISKSIISQDDRDRFTKWKDADGIIIYDADSLRVTNSCRLTTLAAKFIEAGFERIIYGGFASLVETPSLIDTSPLTNIKSPPTSPIAATSLPSSIATDHTSLDPATRLAIEWKKSPFTQNTSTQVAGSHAFFSNIRQNQDLHGGVGPIIPINAPPISPSIQSKLPKWLVEVAYSPDGPQILGRRWETIELTEKQRLESILTGNGMQGRFSISAAVERGEKNRYSNVWPFEWNRVKIPDVPSGQDFFNGSYIQLPQSNRRYIATQAPVPGTFEDFWKVVWGEGVQVIVCLSTVGEGGQIKCHPYWQQNNAGEMHVVLTREKKVSLRPGRQEAIMRTLMLQNGSQPFSPLREIIQLHYEEWPDFGIPAEAETILSLTRILNDIVDQHGKGNNAPVLVHCSAGCGRTGAFCTVDSVVNTIGSIDVIDGEEDVIYRNVLALREQRMSLVQTLRQYILCYNCVLHHLLSKINAVGENQMEAV